MVLGAILLIIITFFMPPVGVFIVSGCSIDLLINVALTVLGVIPGHVHAYYVEYIYYRQAEYSRLGQHVEPAPGIYSDRVQRGGYGTIE